MPVAMSFIKLENEKKLTPGFVLQISRKLSRSLTKTAMARLPQRSLGY